MDSADHAAAQLRRLDQHRDVSDARGRSIPDPVEGFFSMTKLPEEVRTLIFGLLPLKEAVRTCALNRGWKHFWKSYPNLCFDGTTSQSTDDSFVKIERGKLVQTVNCVTQQHTKMGLNKFSVKCDPIYLSKTNHLVRWIEFAALAKVKDLEIQMCQLGCMSARRQKLIRFPLDTLCAHHDGPFIESLVLEELSMKLEPGLLSAFTKLRRLRLHFVLIRGDFSGFLSNCSSLEDLEIIMCSRVSLDIPHQLEKLRHLLISGMPAADKVDFHVAGLTHFEYKGNVVPIVLRGCSKLEKATLKFNPDNEALAHAFTEIPSIAAIKVLNMHVEIEAKEPVWASQVMVTTGSTCKFMNLRHLTCEIIIDTTAPNNHSELLKLAHYLALAPQLETLHLHMLYRGSHCAWEGEVTGEEVTYMCCLKEVYMSGFRCYRAQVELLCGILGKADVLERVTLEPKVTIDRAHEVDECVSDEWKKIRDWAYLTSRRFGKDITIVEEASKSL